MKRLCCTKVLLAIMMILIFCLCSTVYSFAGKYYSPEDYEPLFDVIGLYFGDDGELYGPDDEIVVDYGKCGETIFDYDGGYEGNNDNATYTLDDQGVLRIRGTGTVGDVASVGDFKTLIISDSITSIDEEAFEGCSKLSKIQFSKKLKHVGHDAFKNTKWEKSHKNGPIYAGTVLYKYKGKCPKSLKIKKGTITISEEVMYGHGEKLRKVSFPSSLQYIEVAAFEGCDLRSLSLPKNLKYIGAWAFSCNYKLKKVVIPKSVKEIGAGAFDSCNLKKVIIKNKKIKLGGGVFRANPITDGKGEGPVYVNKMLVECNAISKKKTVKVKNGTTVIASRIFEMTPKITGLKIPKSVKIVGESLFYGCPYIDHIKVDKRNTVYDSRHNCNGIIKTKTNTLIVGCNKTKIPNTVTSIADRAFEGCIGLKAITIPGNVKKIGVSVFYGCSTLKTAKLSNGITDTGEGTFAECTNLKTVKLPNSLKIIGEGAFNKCESLRSIKIPDGTVSIGNTAFDGCKSMKSITVPASVEYIGEGALGYSDYENKKVKGFTIYGYPGSAAEQYATENGFTFVSVE